MIPYYLSIAMSNIKIIKLKTHFYNTYLFVSILYVILNPDYFHAFTHVIHTTSSQNNWRIIGIGTNVWLDVFKPITFISIQMAIIGQNH